MRSKSTPRVVRAPARAISARDTHFAPQLFNILNFYSFFKEDAISVTVGRGEKSEEQADGRTPERVGRPMKMSETPKK